MTAQAGAFKTQALSGMPRRDVLYLSPRGRLCRFIPSRFHAETAEAPRFTFDYVDGAQGFTFSAANLRLIRVVVR